MTRPNSTILSPPNDVKKLQVLNDFTKYLPKKGEDTT